MLEIQEHSLSKSDKIIETTYTKQLIFVVLNGHDSICFHILREVLIQIENKFFFNKAGFKDNRNICSICSTHEGSRSCTVNP